MLELHGDTLFMTAERIRIGIALLLGVVGLGVRQVLRVDQLVYVGALQLPDLPLRVPAQRGSVV